MRLMQVTDASGSLYNTLCLKYSPTAQNVFIRTLCVCVCVRAGQSRVY